MPTRLAAMPCDMSSWLFGLAPSEMYTCGQGSTDTRHGRDHTRQTTVIRMTLLSTEWLFWHCGAHTANPESAR